MPNQYPEHLLWRLIYGQEGPFGLREDGTMKGYGYLGQLPMLGKPLSFMTELSTNTDNMTYPLIVPTLNKSEQLQLQLGEKPTKSIEKKAYDYMLMRRKQFKSPFYD